MSHVVKEYNTKTNELNYLTIINDYGNLCVYDNVIYLRVTDRSDMLIKLNLEKNQFEDILCENEKMTIFIHKMYQSTYDHISICIYSKKTEDIVRKIDILSPVTRISKSDQYLSITYRGFGPKTSFSRVNLESFEVADLKDTDYKGSTILLDDFYYIDNNSLYEMSMNDNSLPRKLIECAMEIVFYYDNVIYYVKYNGTDYELWEFDIISEKSTIVTESIGLDLNNMMKYSIYNFGEMDYISVEGTYYELVIDLFTVNSSTK